MKTQQASKELEFNSLLETNLQVGRQARFKIMSSNRQPQKYKIQKTGKGPKKRKHETQTKKNGRMTLKTLSGARGREVS